MFRRVRLFIDHGAFCEAWDRLDTGAERFGQALRDPDWDRIFPTSVALLKHIPLAKNWEVECDTAYVYAYLRPEDIQRQSDAYRRLHLDLDCRPGFSVRIIEKQRKELKCADCPNQIGWVWQDKGLDARIAVEMLSGALDGHFDVAVLFSDSDELVPVVETVQSVFNKKVVHIGEPETARHLRAAAWANAPFDLAFCRRMSSDPTASTEIASLLELPRRA